MSPILRAYPRWWRDRYGDEVGAIIDAVPRRRGDRADLLRGALDAWLHPPLPSRIPALGALVGGGLWTIVAAGIVAQPVAPDWPGYLIEVLGAVIVAIAFLLASVTGIAIRGLDAAGRAMGLLICLTGAAYAGWLLAVAGSMSAATDGPTLAVAQTLAMIATAAIGALLVRLGDAGIGSLVLLAGVTLLVPWAGAWLAFGAEWTAIGIVLLIERPRRIGMKQGPA